ncbi:MAG: hypothetical protein H0T62_10760 [Parachlamydiaceae bacterium]|nr:hypothetical protein [Parachlamydiaceae bacterium]
MRYLNELSLKNALILIVFSILLISGSVAAGLFYWNLHKQRRFSDPRYHLVAIIQSCSDKEPLQTNYLAELLELSTNQPTNLYRFNVEEAEQKLLMCPLIKSVKIKKIKPGMLYIDYSLRTPIAYVMDYSNTAIDSDGVLIPFKPFNTPKKIPELVLALPIGLKWGTNIFGDKIKLAKEVMKSISQEGLTQFCSLKRIDVSKAFSKKWGEREIVLFFEDHSGTYSNSQTLPHLCMVRFSSQSWQNQLVNYKKLRQNLVLKSQGSPSMVDMRISQLAFITN